MATHQTQNYTSQDAKMIGDLRACAAVNLFPTSDSTPGAVQGWDKDFYEKANKAGIDITHYKTYCNWTSSKYGKPFSSYLHDVWTGANKVWPEGKPVVRKLKGGPRPNPTFERLQQAEKPTAVGPVPPDDENEDEQPELLKPEGWTVAQATLGSTRQLIGHFYKAIVPQDNDKDNAILTVLAQTMSEAVDKVRREHGVDPHSIERIREFGEVLF